MSKGETRLEWRTYRTAPGLLQTERVETSFRGMVVRCERSTYPKADGRPFAMIVYYGPRMGGQMKAVTPEEASIEAEAVMAKYFSDCAAAVARLGTAAPGDAATGEE